MRTGIDHKVGLFRKSIMKIAAIMLALAVSAVTGCSETNKEFVTPERLNNGLVVILPGIEGEGPNSYSIRRGLLKAGVTAALPIYRWGRPIPLAGMILNQTDFVGNRLIAGNIARMIANYQDAHPGKPVWLIGHSGGGGMAVLTADAMEKGRKIDGLILLAASISGNFNLSKPLKHCRKGIVNFYSERDEILGATLFVGNVDGGRASSAGLKGFEKNPPGLHQVPWRREMMHYGNNGRHMDCTSSRFVARYVASWVTGPENRLAR